MRVESSTPWPHLLFERRTPADEPLMVIVVQAVLGLDDESFARPLRAQLPVHLADLYRGDPTCTSLRREGSLATFKPRSDIHVDAIAHAPGGTPASEWPVRIRVGTIDKSLRILGPRAWEHRDGAWKLGAPEPVTEVPMSWERAFGGAHTIDGKRVAEERNPLGTGFLPDGVDTSAPIAAPQILAPDEPEHVAGERYVPQGIAPVSRDAAWRLDHAGTYDETWRRERAPRLPDDFDARFYNSAHPDLIVPGYLRGDEPIELVNLTPSGRLRTGLPGLRYEVVITRRSERDERVEVLPLHLDTLHLAVAAPDPKQHLATLTFRACVPMGEGLRAAHIRAAKG